jgi:hypothetical protein
MLSAVTTLRRYAGQFAALALFLASFPDGGDAAARTAPPPTPPVVSAAARGPAGWDSLRRLDLLPFARQGVRTLQASSADPTGNGDDGYTGRYSCLHHVAMGCLMAEHRGPGELESLWSAGDEHEQILPSGRWIIELDGRVVVDRTLLSLSSGTLASPFVFPLALGVRDAWGGWSINVPMPFRKEMRVISQFDPHYFHVVYRTFASTAGVTTWRGNPGP